MARQGSDGKMHSVWQTEIRIQKGKTRTEDDGERDLRICGELTQHKVTSCYCRVPPGLVQTSARQPCLFQLLLVLTKGFYCLQSKLPLRHRIGTIKKTAEPIGSQAQRGRRRQAQERL